MAFAQDLNKNALVHSRYSTVPLSPGKRSHFMMECSTAMYVLYTTVSEASLKLLQHTTMVSPKRSKTEPIKSRPLASSMSETPFSVKCPVTLLPTLSSRIQGESRVSTLVALFLSRNCSVRAKWASRSGETS